MVLPSGEKIGLYSLPGWMVRRLAKSVFAGSEEMVQRSFSHEKTRSDPSGESAGVMGTSMVVSARIAGAEESRAIEVMMDVSGFMVIGNQFRVISDQRGEYK